MERRDLFLTYRHFKQITTVMRRNDHFDHALPFLVGQATPTRDKPEPLVDQQLATAYILYTLASGKVTRSKRGFLLGGIIEHVHVKNHPVLI